MQFRLAVFSHVQELRTRFGGAIPRGALTEGMVYQGDRVPIWNEQIGIFRPKLLGPHGAALTLMSSFNGPYDDRNDPEVGAFVYKYQGTDPDNRFNRAALRAYEQRRPMLFLVAVRPGHYEALFPAYITAADSHSLSFQVVVDAVSDIAVPGAPEPTLLEVRRAYRTVAAKQRVHGEQFRWLVLDAYSSQCSMCRLKHEPLLDAAHIIPDSDPRGRPILPNGLALCKIHHTAYDVGILGIDPDYRIHLRQDVLDEHDGPMLRYGLQEMHGNVIFTPRAATRKPSREFLAERFEKFRAA